MTLYGGVDGLCEKGFGEGGDDTVGKGRGRREGVGV